MRQEINQKLGKTSKQAMHEKLDEFAKCKEFDELSDIMGEMMAKASDNKKESEEQAARNKQRIQRELEEVSKKYGRVATPSTVKSGYSTGGNPRKAESLVPEQLWTA